MSDRLRFRLWLESDEEEAGTPPEAATPAPLPRRQAILRPAQDEPINHLRDVDAEPRATHPDVVGWYRPILESLLKAHLAINCVAVLMHPKAQKHTAPADYGDPDETRTEPEIYRHGWLDDAITSLYKAHQILEQLMRSDDDRTSLYQGMMYAVGRVGNAIEDLPRGGTRAISALNGIESEINQIIATFSRLEPGMVDDAISELMGDEDVAAWTSEAERISGLGPDRHGRRFWTLVNSWGSPDLAPMVPRWNMHPTVMGNVRQHNADTAQMRDFGIGRPPRPHDHPSPDAEDEGGQ